MPPTPMDDDIPVNVGLGFVFHPSVQMKGDVFWGLVKDNRELGKISLVKDLLDLPRKCILSLGVTHRRCRLFGDNTNDFRMD